jgi:hypothetical protein
MPGFKNDGGMQVNTRVLTIGSAAGGTGGVTYVAENFNYSRPSKTIETTDENDEPNKQYSYKTFVTGTATLQLAASTTPLPQQGWEFTTTLDRGTTPGPTPSPEIFYITDVGAPEAQGQEIKVNVSFRKRIN